MAHRFFIFFAIVIGSALEPSAAAETSVREPRSLIKNKLCQKLGICGGDYGGYQGNQGYQGSQQGNQGFPINIAISQSQSSANGADGGHANGYYPNNYQYNGGYPNHGGYNQGYGGYNQGYGGYNQGYGGYNQGYGGYNQGYGGSNQGYGGYQGYKPGYGNGQSSYNSQFNGNYYGGQQGGGYGFQKPFGQFYDEDGEDSRVDGEGFGFARSLAVAESKS